MRKYASRLCSLAAALMVAGCADDSADTLTAPAAPVADAAPIGTFNHPWIGANVGLTAAFERDVILDFADGANLGWVRATVYWYEIQPHTNQFDAAKLADLKDYVNRANARGMKVFLTLEGSPGWARLCNASNMTPEGQNCGTPLSPPHDAMYAWWRQYVTDLVRELPTVDHWGVWNEPNDPYFLNVAPGRDPVLEYGKLVAYASDAIHGTAGNLLVGPDLANRAGQKEFLARVMAHSGHQIDIVSVHSYQPAQGTVAMLRDYRSIGFRQPMWLTEFALWEGIGTQTDEFPQAANVTGMIKQMYAGQLDAQNVFPFHLYNSDQGYQMLTRQSPGNYRPRWAYDCLRALASNNWSNLPWYCQEHGQF
jgi:hypothetical protein